MTLMIARHDPGRWGWGTPNPIGLGEVWFTQREIRKVQDLNDDSLVPSHLLRSRVPVHMGGEEHSRSPHYIILNQSGFANF